VTTKKHRCRICRGDRPNDGVICLGCGTALLKCQETRKKRPVTECPGCRASGPFKVLEAGRFRCTKCTAVFEQGDFDFVDDRPDVNVEKKERLEMDRKRGAMGR